MRMKWSPCALLCHNYQQELKVEQPLWEKVWQFLKMLNKQLPNDLAIPLLSICPGERKTYVHTNLYINVHSSIIKQPKSGNNLNAHQLENEQMWYIHTMEYHLATKRTEATDTFYSLDEPLKLMLCERSQSQEPTQAVYDSVYIKYLGQENLQRQKLPRAGEKGYK